MNALAKFEFFKKMMFYLWIGLKETFFLFQRFFIFLYEAWFYFEPARVRSWEILMNILLFFINVIKLYLKISFWILSIWFVIGSMMDCGNNNRDDKCY